MSVARRWRRASTLTGEHEAAALVLKKPLLQVAHVEEPFRLEVPGKQERHAARVVAETSGLKVPPGHSEHVVAPREEPN